MDVSFVHLEDEILAMSWIPRSIRTHLLRRLPGANSNAIASQDDRAFSFRITNAADSLNINYEFVETIDDFKKINIERLQSAFIILDLMGLRPDSRYKLVGLDAFDWLMCSAIKTDRICVLTGYAKHAREALAGKLDDSRIHIKPITPLRFTGALLDMAGIAAQGGNAHV